MSFEAIEKVVDTEQRMQQEKQAAAAAAKKLIADAEQAGKEQLEQARLQAEAENKKRMAAADIFFSGSICPFPQY